MSDKELKNIISELSQVKRLALKKIEALQGESEWNLLQQIVQEIEATAIVNKNQTSNAKLLELLKQEVKARYNDQPDLLELMEEGIPSTVTIHNWRRKKGWGDAVWMKVRGEGLFTNDQRSKVINKLFDQAAIDGNVQAAKIWLTLSGDYSEKDATAKNDAADIFKRINETIHSKK